MSLTIPLVTTLTTKGASFLPSDLSGLIAWYDFTDESTISDTNGAVNSVTDKSGVGRTLTASGATRPTTGSRTINGLNVLDFDGAGDFLALSSVITNNEFTTNGGTICIVAANDDLVNGSAWAARDGTFGANYLVQGNDSLNTVIQLNSLTIANPDEKASTAAVSMIFSFNATGTDGSVFINGSNVNSTTSNSGLNFQIGRIGDYSGSANDADGGLGEWMVFNRQLQTSEIASVNDYFVSKFGIT